MREGSWERTPERALTAPLHLEPLLVPKPWGGRRLERLGRTLPAGQLIGESWEVADLDPAATAVPDPATRVAAGPHAGSSLAHLIDLDPDALLGDAADRDGRFPLLVKLLDAREPLSVQVHPPANYAVGHPGAREKTETWVILDADPDGEVFIGLRPGVTLGDLEAAAGTPDLVRLLRRVPAVPGDVHHLPAGTVHALGAGVLAAEVQTPSDTTFRLYDWTEEYGRQPRDLHPEAALRSIALAWEGNVSPRHVPADQPAEIDAPAYRLVRQRAEVGVQLRSDGDRVAVLLVVDGGVEGAGLVRPLGAGDAVVLPAAWVGTLSLRPGTTLLEVRPVSTCTRRHA